MTSKKSRPEHRREFPTHPLPTDRRDRHDTETANSRKGHSILLTIQTTSYPLELSFFSVPGVVAVPAGRGGAEGLPDAVGNEGVPGLLLGGYADEVEVGGETWEGLGSSRLERYVYMCSCCTEFGG